MESILETAGFFEQAKNTLHDISQKVCYGSDIMPRHYISVLKDCLTRIRELKEEALNAVHAFDDDCGLNDIVSSCNEVLQLSNHVVAKIEQYSKHFSTTTESGNEISKSNSVHANNDLASDDSDDENIQNEMEEHTEVADAETAVEHYNSEDHCKPAVTAVSSSPQPPAPADYGITKETLERLALLKVKGGPQRSTTSVSQNHSEAASLNSGSCQNQIKTETVVGQAVSCSMHSDHPDMPGVDESNAAGRAALQPCGNTRYDIGLFSSSPEVPVLSSFAHQYLHSGLKPK